MSEHHKHQFTKFVSRIKFKQDENRNFYNFCCIYKLLLFYTTFHSIYFFISLFVSFKFMEYASLYGECVIQLNKGPYLLGTTSSNYQKYFNIIAFKIFSSYKNIPTDKISTLENIL